MNVIIGLYKGSKSAKVAKSKGFKVYENAEAVKRADVIFVAVPDTLQADIFKNDIEPNLTKGKTLLFSHGFTVHFKTVVPPKDVNVILVAPKGPGHRPSPVRRGQGRAEPDRHRAERRSAGQEDRPRVGQGYWRYAGRWNSRPPSRRKRNRLVRRTDCAA